MVIGDQVEDPEDMFGARLFAEHDEIDEKKTKAAELRSRTLRHMGDVTDSTKHGVKSLGQGKFGPVPTGTGTTTPNVPVFKAAPGPPAADLATGVVVAAVVGLELMARLFHFLSKPSKPKGEK